MLYLKLRSKLYLSHLVFHIIEKFLDVIRSDHSDGFPEFGDYHHIISWLDADELSNIHGDDDLSLGTYGHIPMDFHINRGTGSHDFGYK